MNKKTTHTSLKEGLDSGSSHKQVDALIANVCDVTSIDAHKICFIKEQLAEQNYVINAQHIASKMLAYTKIRLPALEPES